jgi:hypothetical protein
MERMARDAAGKRVFFLIIMIPHFSRYINQSGFMVE